MRSRYVRVPCEPECETFGLRSGFLARAPQALRKYLQVIPRSLQELGERKPQQNNDTLVAEPSHNGSRDLCER